MKNFILTSVIAIFALYSCNKEKNIASDSQNTSPKTDSVFSVDSVKVKDSAKLDKNLTALFESKVLVFPHIENKTLLDSIYADENFKNQEYSASGLLNALNDKKKEFFDETKESLKDWKPDFEQTWESRSNMEIFSNQNELLTLKYSGDGFTGGAHGYYFENYKVFDLKNKKKLQLSDIITNPDSKIWNRILMDNFLINDLGKGQSEMLLVKEIPLNNNFYFDQKNLYFLYNQYEITAYAAGTVLIKIPLSDIKSVLTPELKTRINLR